VTRREDMAGSGFVWAAVGLTAAYVLVHLSMLYASLLLWGGLFGAAFGQ
jgi:hypothetical protein